MCNNFPFRWRERFFFSDTSTHPKSEDSKNKKSKKHLKTPQKYPKAGRRGAIRGNIVQYVAH